MNKDLAKCCQCFGAYIDGEIVAFAAVLHQPHFIVNLKRLSRMVVLPDYQGIGLGGRLVDFVAGLFDNEGFEFHVSTSAKNFIERLERSPRWRCTHYTKSQPDRIHFVTRDRKLAMFKFLGKTKPIGKSR